MANQPNTEVEAEVPRAARDMEHAVVPRQMRLIPYHAVFFNRREFPHINGVSEMAYADPELIATLDNWRKRLGNAIYPSPVPGALARFDGSTTSMHHVRMEDDFVVQGSRAVDVFPTGRLCDAWLHALGTRTIGGLGVYYDTHFRDEPWPMLHIDIRPRAENRAPVMWCRIRTNSRGIRKSRYIYPQNPATPTKDVQKFWELLAGHATEEHY